MKNLLLVLLVVLQSSSALASSTLYTNSSSVGIGTSSPTTGVALDLGSNTNSMLLPVGTTGQRPTGVAGMIRYNSTNSVPEFYVSSWLPVPLTASSPLAINSTTGNITCSTCNTSSANVNSVSGDGTLISNSVSTGAVTLTLGNAPAYSLWGNNTSSSGAPAYTSSPEVSGTITDLQSIGASSTDGLILTNTTAAVAGSQQWSPRIRWTGQGWKTSATAASQETDAIVEVQPVQGAANPTFNWVLSGQLNGGGYSPLLTVPSSGGLNLNSGNYLINGTQISAANLINGVNGSGSIVLTVSPSLTTPNIGAATGTSLITSGMIESQSGGFKFPDGSVQTTAAGSNGMVLLATVNASGASSVSFDATYLTGSYSKYVLEFDSIITSDSGVLCLNLSTNNGSSYITSGYSGNTNSTCQVGGNLAPGVLGTSSSTSTQPGAGTLKISSPSASKRLNLLWDSVAYDGTRATGAAINSSTTAVNAIRIQDCVTSCGSPGTITGNFHLYGLSGT